MWDDREVIVKGCVGECGLEVAARLESAMCETFDLENGLNVVEGFRK